MTKKELIDDIILRVTKGAPSDDLELEPSQIAFWFDLVAADVAPQYFNSLLNKGGVIPASSIEIEDNKEAEVEDVTMLDGFRDRVYITLLKQPLELHRDRGIIRVITEEGLVVNKASIEHLDTLNSLTFGRPNRDNLIYTRINDKLYIQGLSPKHVGITQFSVYYIPKTNIQDLEDDDEVGLPDDVIGLISDAVEEKARKQMLGVEDLENDAEQDID